MKYFCLFLLLLATLPLTAQKQNVNTIIRELKNPNSSTVLVAAHRGDWRNAPENSLMAIEKAVAMGVDIVEIDIQRTRDGHLVLMHDETVDRTTNGKGYVKDMTLEDVRRLHLRNGIDRATRHTVPTLEEAMLAVKGKAMVNLDKGYEFMEEAYAILQNTGTVDHAIFKGKAKAADVKKRYGHLLDKVFYIGIVNLDAADAETTIRELQRDIKPVALEVIFTQDTARVFNTLKNIRTNGARIWINSLWASLNAGHDDDLSETDEKNSFGWILDQGANLIQTDRPYELLAYLRSQQVRKGMWIAPRK